MNLSETKTIYTFGKHGSQGVLIYWGYINKEREIITNSVAVPKLSGGLDHSWIMGKLAAFGTILFSESREQLIVDLTLLGLDVEDAKAQ